MNKEEKRVTFDKNFIQGLKSEKIAIYSKPPYKPLITVTLQYEILGTLAKSDKEHLKKNKGKSNEDLTTGLFSKIKDMPVSSLLPAQLISKELSGQPIKIRHDFFNFGVGEEGLDIFDDLDSSQVTAWAKGEFTQEDQNTAKEYRDALYKKQQELEPSIKKGDVLEHLLFFRASYSGNRKHYESYLEKWVKFHLNNPVYDEVFDKIKNKLAVQSLASFAPYSAYCFVVDLYFHQWYLHKRKEHGIPINLSADFIDYSYIHYFPFIDIFISEDKIFHNFINDEKIAPYFKNKIDLRKNCNSSQ